MKKVSRNESSNFKGLRDLNTIINPSEDEYLFKTKDGALITLESTRKIIYALREHHSTGPSKPLTTENKFIGKRPHKKATTSKKIVERNELPQKSKKVERNSKEVRNLNTVIKPSDDKYLFNTKQGTKVKATSSKKIVEPSKSPEKSNKREKVERNSKEVRNLNAVINPSDDQYLFKTKDGARITLESARKIICALRNDLCEDDNAATSGPSTSDSKLLDKHPIKKNQKTNLNPERKRKRTSGGGSSAKCPRYEKVEMKKPNKNVVDVKTDKKKFPDPDRSTYTDVPLEKHVVVDGSFTICEMDEESDESKTHNDVFNVVCDKEKVPAPDHSIYTDAPLQNHVSANGASTIRELNEESDESKTDGDVFNVVGDKEMLSDPDHSTYTDSPLQNPFVANGSFAICEMNEESDKSKIHNDMFNVVGDKENHHDRDRSTYTNALVQSWVVANGALTIHEMNSPVKYPQYENVKMKEVDKDVFNFKTGKKMLLELLHATFTDLLLQNHGIANCSLTICEMDEESDKSKIVNDVVDVRTGNDMLPELLYETNTNAPVQNRVSANGASIICALRNEFCENDDADTSGPSTSDSKLLGKHPIKKNQKTNLNPERKRKRTSVGGSSAKCPRYEKVEMKKPNKNMVEVKTDKKKLPDPNRSIYTDVPLQNHVVADGSFTICEMDEESDESKTHNDVFNVVCDKEKLPAPDHSIYTDAPLQNHVSANGASTIRELNEESDESKVDKDVKTDKTKKEKTLEEQDADMIRAAQLLRMLMMGVHFKSVAVFQTPVICEIDMDSESTNMDMECF